MVSPYFEDIKYVCENWRFFTLEEKSHFLEYLSNHKEKDFVAKAKEIIYLEKDSRYLSRIIKIFNFKGIDLGKEFYRFLLDHPDARVRANALEGLKEELFLKYKSFIERFLTDSDNRVRANAIKLFWKNDQRKAKKILNSMLLDEDMWMKISGLYVILSLELSEYLEKVISVFSDINDLVREWAYKTAIVIGKKKLDLLLERLKEAYFEEDNHFLRRIIIEFLLDNDLKFLEKILFQQEKLYLKQLILKGFQRKNYQTQELEKYFALYKSLGHLEEELKLTLLNFISQQKEKRELKVDFFISLLLSSEEGDRIKEKIVKLLGKEKGIEKEKILAEIPKDNYFYNMIVKELSDG